MTLENMKNSLALIGYMGTGKTLIGRILAERLDLNLVETDRLIEQRAGITIPELFEREGETGFREREIAAVKEITGEGFSVIACGGGLVLNRINIDRLKENCVIVYLRASPKTILKRVSGEAGQRPLLEVEDQLKTITEMLKFRRPLYERAADITVNTTGISPNEVADKIILKLEQYEGFDIKK
ncbi:MAG: shikimate kinase [Dehalococcoidales bacterium]|nr:shikimate kinase [Dehalococcoidales bacterium]